MKLKIAEWEVEIKAHNEFSQRHNKYDVMSLLNEISLICDYASQYMKQDGCESISRRYYNIGDDIYRALKENGAYYEE